MHTQTSLFEQTYTGQFRPARALARVRDPRTSKEAARKCNESGVPSVHGMILLQLIRARPGLISSEMPEYCSLGRHQVSRRLGELRDMNLIQAIGTRENAGKRREQIWYPK